MNTINILLSVNSLFLEPLKVLLFSLFKTQTFPIAIHFFNEALSGEEQENLKKFCEKLSFKLSFYEIPLSFKKSVKVQEKKLKENKLTVETYFRLLAPLMLPFLDRILWLDADCLVQRDLKDFYFQDLGDNFIAACDHAAWNIEGLDFSYFPRKPHGEYFNAGVILFDLKKCRKIRGFQLDNLEKVVRMNTSFFDQDVLNEFFRGRVLYCDPLKYNMFLNQDWDHSFHNHPIQYKLYKEAFILHYCCPNKPWDVPCILEYEKAKYWLNMRDSMNQELEKKNDQNICRCIM